MEILGRGQRRLLNGAAVAAAVEIAVRATDMLRWSEACRRRNRILAAPDQLQWAGADPAALP